MKWIELLRKDDYALLQSESDTQYCVARGYDPTQQINSGVLEPISHIGMVQNGKQTIYRLP
mgnify:CR=1 FL=1